MSTDPLKLVTNGHVVNGRNNAASAAKKDNDVDDAATSDDDVKLSELFDAAHEALSWIESSTAPSSNDATVQRRIIDAVKDLEWATVAASRLDLFSANEDVDELPTSSLKFLLLPAYLGRLTNKKAAVVGGGACAGAGAGATAAMTAGRKGLVDMAVIYFEDFLQRLADYGVFTAPMPTSKIEKRFVGGNDDAGGRPTAPPDLRALNAEREAKIRRFKENKAREERLEAWEEKRKGKKKLEEEDERNYWMETLDDWAVKAADDLKSLLEEREILEFMSQRGSNPAASIEKSEKPKKRNDGNPFAGKPFILTRNALQKQVFGMGYPSLPSMTVEEWYEEQAAAGLLPTPDQSRAQMDRAMTANDPRVREEEEEQRTEEEEKREEEDDEETRRKKIEWDEWKDDHRRGWGNRKNMG